MAVEQPSTLRVVTAGKVVEAEWRPSGVPGLALAGRPLTTGWRLIHVASGRAVSRSAEHLDPAVVEELARRISHLADWTSTNVAVSVPRLREQLDKVMEVWRAEHPEPASPVQPVRATIDSGGTSGGDLEELIARVRAAEHERMVLREVLRTLHENLPAGAFAEVLGSLGASEQELVRSILPVALTDPAGAVRPDGDTTAVVQAIRARPTPGTKATAPQRAPSRPRPPRSSGPDVAAS